MLVADLHGKLMREELDLGWRENILTSSVFGTLQYLPRAVLAAVLSHARDRNPGSRLAGLDIGKFAETCSFGFWPTCSVSSGGEIPGRVVPVVPDLILRTSGFVIVIECKLESRLGQDPTQLRREFQLTCRPVHADGCVVAVTAPWGRPLFDRARAECVAAVRDYVAPDEAIAARLAWISWADVAGALEGFGGMSLSGGERTLLEDLVAVLHRHSFRVYRGIREPSGSWLVNDIVRWIPWERSSNCFGGFTVPYLWPEPYLNAIGLPAHVTVARGGRRFVGFGAPEACRVLDPVLKRRRNRG